MAALWRGAALALLALLAGLLPAQAISVAGKLRAAPLGVPLAQVPSGLLGPVVAQPVDLPFFSEVRVTNVASANATANATAAHAQSPGATFQSYYNAYGSGRGIWKWSNAIDAYQRHFSCFAGRPTKLAEVGVQSGGSITMWQKVLGPQCHVFGIDINVKTRMFEDALSTIVIGDQGDPNMWNNFFANTVNTATGLLNILVDDGGHEPNQMYVTLVQSFDKISPGGMVAIEDIHGLHYVQSFFIPAAHFLGAQAQAGLLDSVHLYPFLLVAQRAGTAPQGVQSTLAFSGRSTVVAEFAQLWTAIPLHPGGHVILENAGWGPFLTAQGISNFLQVFAPLHASTWSDYPTGCEHTADAVCTVQVQCAPMQSMVTGIHVYPTRLVVEVAGSPVNLQAVRHGDQWITYG